MVSDVWDLELVPTPGGRTSAPSPDCPVEIALAAISGKWTTLILRDLMDGYGRGYSELSRALPQLSDKVLTDRLRELVAEGYLARYVERGYPDRVHYAITDRGKLLRPLLIELYRTGDALRCDSQDADADSAGNVDRLSR